MCLHEAEYHQTVITNNQEDACHRLNQIAKFDDRTLIWKLMHPL